MPKALAVEEITEWAPPSWLLFPTDRTKASGFLHSKSPESEPHPATELQNWHSTKGQHLDLRILNFMLGKHDIRDPLYSLYILPQEDDWNPLLGPKAGLGRELIMRSYYLFKNCTYLPAGMSALSASGTHTSRHTCTHTPREQALQMLVYGLWKPPAAQVTYSGQPYL